MIGVMLFFQVEQMSEILMMANFWPFISKIWACAELEFRLCSVKLCSSDNQYIIVPELHYRISALHHSTFSLLFIIFIFLTFTFTPIELFKLWDSLLNSQVTHYLMTNHHPKSRWNIAQIRSPMDFGSTRKPPVFFGLRSQENSGRPGRLGAYQSLIDITWYPLANIQKTLENHHSSCVNQRPKWPFSIANC